MVSVKVRGGLVGGGENPKFSQHSILCNGISIIYLELPGKLSLL